MSSGWGCVLGFRHLFGHRLEVRPPGPCYGHGSLAGDGAVGASDFGDQAFEVRSWGARLGRHAAKLARIGRGWSTSGPDPRAQDRCTVLVMSEAPVSNSAAPPTRWWLTLDAVIILIFVIVGRDTHQESQTVLDVIETAAPFLWALLAGWLVTRAWKDPISFRTGIGVASVTIVGGVVLRRLVYADGIATPFIIVTALFLLATMLGWRGVVQLWRKRFRRSVEGLPTFEADSAETPADVEAPGG